MAFVNEKLTAEQRAVFEQKGIKNPNPQRVGDVLTPLYWTIDYESEMCLIGAGEYREFIDEKYFVFTDTDKVIRFVAKQYFHSEYSLEWEIFRIVDGLEVTKTDVENISSALSVYQVSGRPREKDTSIRVTFSINVGGHCHDLS